jgi:signal recognition particle receptor subunit alpha
MLEEVVVVTKGGLVLFKHSLETADKEDVSTKKPLSSLNELIQKVVIEGETGSNHFSVMKKGFFVNTYTNTDHSKVIKYILDNQYGWLVAGLLPKVGSSQFIYVDDVLLEVQQWLMQTKITHNEGDFDPLHEKMKQLITLSKAEDKEVEASVAMRKFQETKKFQNVSEQTKTRLKERQETDEKQQEPNEDNRLRRNLEHLPARFQNKKSSSLSPKKKSTTEIPFSSPDIKKKEGKKPLKWETTLSVEEAASLDYSRDKPTSVITPSEKVSSPNILNTHEEPGCSYDVTDMEYSYQIDQEEDEDESQNIHQQPKKEEKSRWLGFFKSLTGNRTVTQEELVSVLIKIQEHLVSKNVATSTAERLCESVKLSLIGKNIGSLGRVEKLVRETLELDLQKILTPKQSIDILRDIQVAKEQGRPYIMVFCGVNGVGKSTNLAKICFWLLQNRLRVLIAACDTFRSGAVEQLRVHTRNLQSLNVVGDQLQVELYEKGYGKDAAAIAKDAITYSKKSNSYIFS